MRIGKIIFVSSMSMLLGSSTSPGFIYIDDFSTTQTLTGAVSGATGYISGPGILGTERDTQAFAPTVNINSAVPGQFLSRNDHPVNWGTIFLTYDGVDGNTSGSFLNGLGNVDLTEGGVNDRFRIDVTAADNRGGSLDLTVRNINGVGSIISVALPTSPGVLDLRFADFQISPFGATRPVNFADVGHIEVRMGLNPGESYSFDSIAVTIPEPTTAALLLVGGVAAVCFWRKKSARITGVG